MAIDPTISLGFRAPMAAVATQPDPLEMVSRMVSLKTLMNRMQGGQSLGSMMATTGNTTGDVNAGQGYPLASQTAPAVTVQPTAPPGAAASSLMMGVSRNGANVHSTDGGKTWLSSDTGNPITGDVYQQTVVLGGQ